MTDTNIVERFANKWSDMEVSRLKELLGKMTAAEIGAQIGRTKSSILKKVRSLGLQNSALARNEKWSDSLIEKLKLLGPTMTAKQFQSETGVTKDSCYNHAKKYKIKFRPDTLWTEEDIEILRRLGNAADAAKALGKRKDNVLRKAKALNIPLKESRQAVPMRDRKQAIHAVNAVKDAPVQKKRYVTPEVLERLRKEAGWTQCKAERVA
jgi:hypothetical protein